MSWEWILQPAIALLVFLGLIGINILIWVFAWGKSRGRTNARLSTIEEKLDNPGVRPDCVEIFNEIREKLADLGGKVQTILIFMEKKHNVGKRKKE